MPAEWTFLLGDVLTGAFTAEIPLTGARPGVKLNAAGTMNGTWVLDRTWAGGDPYTLTAPARTMLVAMRDQRPMWAGPIWTRRWDPGAGKVELGAADFLSYFERRYVLPPFTPDGTTSQISGLTTTFAQVEQNDIMRALVSQAQAHPGGNLGIVADTTVSGILRDRTYAGHELVDVATALKNLAEVIDGPDFYFSVAPELDANGRIVKTLRLGTPKLGQTGSPHVFETDANVISWTWPSDGTRMATRTYATGEGIEAGALIAVAEDNTKHADGWPLLEAETAHSTVSVDATLAEHVAADLTRSRLPVVTPTLTVRGDTQPGLHDFSLGDEVRVILRDPFASLGIDTQVRIIGIDYDPGSDGVETATITVDPIFDNVV